MNLLDDYYKGFPFPADWNLFCEQASQHHLWREFSDSLQLSLDQQWFNPLLHSSFIHEHHDWRLKSNESLEFLGDAILDAIIVSELMKQLPQESEGQLSKLKNTLVNESQLAAFARFVGIDRVILLGRGEFQQNSMLKDSILADCFEALVGHVFLMNGFNKTQEWLVAILEKYKQVTGQILFDLNRLNDFDPKSRLQELSMKLHKVVPKYESGAVGNEFEVRLFIGKTLLGKSIGANKRLIEEKLAKEVLESKKYLSIS